MHKHATFNRLYRLVWSNLHQAWVVVAENVRGSGKGGRRKRAGVLIAQLLGGAAPLALAAPPLPTALPTGGQVVAGQAAIATNGSNMTVTQGSAQAILNWTRFDIGSSAAVRFQQPSSSAVALNRVLANDPSQIYGQLSANGQVFLVNPQGILFAPGARVDVGGLVASSLAISDQDFLGRQYRFTGDANAGAVRNAGSIRIARGGSLALLAPNVSNTGNIDAAGGSVNLAAAEQVNLDLRGDGLITVKVERGAVNALAQNSGQVHADDGQITLTASAADALAHAAVNNSGVLRARGIVADGGRIRLIADGGDVQTGTLDVSSNIARGGDITVQGNFISLDGAVLADGATGGTVSVNAAGTLSVADTSSARGLAGAGGAVALQAAGTIVESSTARTDVSGATDGGSLRVQADGGLLSSAQHVARGETGKGGRIDLSGDSVRLLSASADASGQVQGGLVRVGGAFQGGQTRDDAPDVDRFVYRWGQMPAIQSARKTFLNDATKIDVSARGTNGQGGTAVVWSNDETTQLGSIDARGAAAAGTVEISSKNELRHVGLEKVTLGAGGRLLLDPKNITIGSYPNVWTYQALLGKGYTGGKNMDVNLSEGDGFGYAVALNSAGNRLAVGAPYDKGMNGSGTMVGAVRLFSFSDANFSDAKIEGTIGRGYSGGKNYDMATLADYDQFGTSVALNAAGDRLAVGASGADGGTGAVHLFRFGDTSFSVPTLQASLSHATYSLNGMPFGAAFGSSVALNGTGDLLAVGALSSGEVYLFGSALSTAPSLSKTIGSGSGYGYNTGLASDSQFGTSVSFNATGDRLAVGAVGVDNLKGAVYLYSNPYGIMALEGVIGSGKTGGKNVSVSLLDGELFGSGVALSADGKRLAVGASATGSIDSTNGGPGSVRIIDFADSNFSSGKVSATLGRDFTVGADADLTLNDWDNFGFSVAMSGDGQRLVVGAPFANDASGSLYNTGMVHAFALLPAPATTSMSFGSAPKGRLDATVDAATLANTLSAGTSITLQASNDITLAANNAINVNNASGNGGNLTLQAGRSVALNSSITTDGGNLTIVANEKLANGVVNIYRDAGAATISTAAGTTINAGSGQVSMTISDGAGKTYATSGDIALGGSITAGKVLLVNQGPTAGSDVILSAGASVNGTGAGTSVEIAAAGSGGGTFTNNAGAGAIGTGSGRYLVYSDNPTSTNEGLSGYNKHYAQTYTAGATPAYAGSGNWFLYSVQPTLTVTANSANKTYDGSATASSLTYNASGFIDGDTTAVMTGSLARNSTSKNAGTYVNDIVQGTLGTGLGYKINFTPATYTISKRPLNFAVTGVNKTYDGTASASVSFSDDRILNDDLSYTQIASFSDKNVGQGKTISVSGISLGGADKNNYTISATTASASADITKAALTVTASQVTKTYDGTTSAGGTATVGALAGAGAGESVNTAATQTFLDKNAGSNKTVRASGLTIKDSGNADVTGNYDISYVDNTTSTINKAALTVTASQVTKTYDGTTSAGGTATVGALAGAGAGESVNTAATQTFLDKNAGSNKTVRASGLTIKDSGNADVSGNYDISYVDNTTSTINKAALTVTASQVTKTYDGTTSAGGTATVGALAGAGAGESVNTTTQSFIDKNAGTNKTVHANVTIKDSGNADVTGNYDISYVDNTTSTINKAALTVTASQVTKTYDGTTSAGGTATVGALAGAGAGESVNTAATQAFLDKNAGSNKTVRASGLTIKDSGNADVTGNYDISYVDNTTSTINKAALTVTASQVTKTYDGTTSAGGTATVGALAGAGAGESVNTAATQAFLDKNAGSNKTVRASGLTIKDSGNADVSGNYDISYVDNTTSTINKAALTVTASQVTKTYDGTTSAGGTATVGALAGAGAGESVNTAATQAFLDKNAGSNKTVRASGLTIKDSGNADVSGNYDISYVDNTTSTINKAALTVTAQGADKVYDGTASATVVLQDNRIAGDVLSVSSSGAAFSDKNAGIGKTITVSGLALSGADASNYTITSSVTSNADITPKALTAAIGGTTTKVYDGTTVAAIDPRAYHVDGTITGESVTISKSTGIYDSANVLDARTVSTTLTGADFSAGSGTLLSNYLLPTAATGSGTITPKSVSVVGMLAKSKVYDGNTVATLDNPGTLSGLINGQVLTLNRPTTGVFDSKNAGTNKTVTATGYTIADGPNGERASNYLLTSNTVTNTAGVIERATLTVRADDKERKFGEENPAFSVSYIGLVPGETSDVALPLTATSTATRLSPVGAYAIKVSGEAMANNYHITYVDGTLNVTSAFDFDPIVKALTNTVNVPTMSVTSGTSVLSPQAPIPSSSNANPATPSASISNEYAASSPNPDAVHAGGQSRDERVNQDVTPRQANHPSNPDMPAQGGSPQSPGGSRRNESGAAGGDGNYAIPLGNNSLIVITNFGVRKPD